MIEVSQRIEVPASPQAVWTVLSDPHAVVECVKGASLGERHEDGSYDAGLLVSFGPATVTFRPRCAQCGLARLIFSRSHSRRTSFSALSSARLRMLLPPRTALPRLPS